MNPLTLVKRIQSINSKEAELGISDDASWHAKYKDSAYVFAGGIPYDLTEGDLLAVFAQYGEIVDVNLVRDKATGKSKGFAFIAYEDQRSTTLAVDNLNGASLGGRIIRVDHVAKYKKKEEEDEETERLKREERGVCRAFQKGECKYGDSCKFSHDEQRAANTGWGHEEDKRSKWENDKYDISRDNKRSHDVPPSRGPDRKQPDGRSSRGKFNIETTHRPSGGGLIDPQDTRERGKLSGYREDHDKRTIERRSSKYESESKSRDDYDKRDEKKSGMHDSIPSMMDSRDGKERDRNRNRDRDRERTRVGEKRSIPSMMDSRDGKDRDIDRDRERTRDGEKRSSYSRDSSPRRHRDRDVDHHRARRDENSRSRR